MYFCIFDIHIRMKLVKSFQSLKSNEIKVVPKKSGVMLQPNNRKLIILLDNILVKGSFR